MEEKINEFERQFEHWLQELEELDIVLTYEKQPKTFIVYPPLPIEYTVELKTRTKQESWNLLPDIKYTADFKIVFNKEKPFSGLIANLNDWGIEETRNPRGFLFFTTQKTRSGHFIVYVDVKPPSDAVQRNSAVGSSREFPVKQRILIENHNIFINKIIPYGSANCLFAHTFTPDKFLYTEKRTKIRAVKKHKKTKKELYTLRTVKEFLKQISRCVR